MSVNSFIDHAAENLSEILGWVKNNQVDIQDPNKKLLGCSKAVYNLDFQVSEIEVIIGRFKGIKPRQKLVYNLDIQVSEIEEIIELFKGIKPRQKAVCNLNIQDE